MSSNIALKIDNLSKCYQIYDQPVDRLKQYSINAIRRFNRDFNKKYYKEFWALRDINFEVKRGEAVGILGRNGSGKSTLLQLITGTLSPTTGSIFKHGRIAALLELGSGFNPEFSGVENVYLNGALLGMSKSEIDNKFDGIASFADIGSHLTQPVKTYSSGMMLRLAFAVQVQLDPEILIIDEALAVGDWLFQKRCFQKIEQLKSNGTTLLFVSHEQESIRTLTDRAVLLSHGELRAIGPSSEVILDYRRLLHDDETKYLRSVVEGIEKKSDPNILMDSLQAHTMSEKLSFGEQEAQICSVEIFDCNGNAVNTFTTSEPIKIIINCVANSDISRLNVGMRIRNREGVKVYSWGTLNQDMALANANDSSRFWDKHFQCGEKFSIEFLFNAVLGANLYEIQASISYEDTPDYNGQRMLHWVDESAFFNVAVPRYEYFFGGIVDLKMTAKW